MLLSHRQTLSRRACHTFSLLTVEQHPQFPACFHTGRARKHSLTAPEQQLGTFKSWLCEVLRRGCPEHFWCWNKMEFIGFYSKQLSPVLWFYSDCSCEQQLGLWMLNAGAHISSAFTAWARPCWRAGMLKNNLCKETKQIRAMTFCNFFVGYNLSSANFTADTSWFEISIPQASFKQLIKIPFACMTLGLRLNCSSIIKRSLNNPQSPPVSWWHCQNGKTWSHYPSSN